MSTPQPPAPRGADISIEVEINDRGSRVWLSDRQTRRVQYPGELSTVNLATRRKTLQEWMTNFVKKVGPALDVGGPRPDPKSWFYDYRNRRYEKRKWGILTEAVKLLYSLGQRLADDLFGDDTPRVAAVFRDALGAAASQSLDDAGNLPLIDVKARVDEFVPIELLMLLAERPKAPESITSREQLEEALRPFVGFANAVVRRNIGTATVPQTHELDDTPRLPVKLFSHPGLWRAGKSLARLKEDRWIVLDDTRPEAGAVAPGAFPCHVAEHLWIHDGRMFDGNRYDRPFQVQHFACHFEAGTKDPDENSLLLDNGEEFRVSLGRLKECRQQNNFGAYKGRAHPLVFLNACGSAVVDPAGVTSFPEYLMRYGSCGFIGTEALVPEWVAEAFAEAFYDAFLRRKPLGLAIQLAKRSLLENHHNPLGILYTVYANPDMTVRNGNVPV